MVNQHRGAESYGWRQERLPGLPEHWAAYGSGSDRGLGVYVPAADEVTCYTYHAVVSDGLFLPCAHHHLR